MTFCPDVRGFRRRIWSFANFSPNSFIFASDLGSELSSVAATRGGTTGVRKFVLRVNLDGVVGLRDSSGSGNVTGAGAGGAGAGAGAGAGGGVGGGGEASRNAVWRLILDNLA